MSGRPPYPEIFVDWHHGTPERGIWVTTVGAQADFAKIGTTAEAAVGMRCIFYAYGDAGEWGADDEGCYIGTVVLDPQDGTPLGVKDPGTRVLTRGEMIRSGYDFSEDHR